MEPLPEAYSISEFCRAHRFSRGSYYNLPPDQRPREIRVGKRVLISREAAEAWRRRMEDRAAPLPDPNSAAAA